MYKGWGLFLFTIFIATSGFAKVKLAFLELRDNQGQLISLEPGGRFGHVAISYKNGWLHSFPPYKVEWVPSLEPYGEVAEIVEVETPPNYNSEFINQELGKDSKINSDWHDDESTYCSKLVGKILGIPPRPNNWSAPVWAPLKLRGELAEFGLSPDDIYEHFLISRISRHPIIIPYQSCNSKLH